MTNKKLLKALGGAKEKYCRIELDKYGKKQTEFGKTWGAMSKSEANASFLQTGKGFYVIDVDFKKYDNAPQHIKDFVKGLGEPTMITARGSHWYILGDSIAAGTTDIFKDENWGVDIRNKGNIIFSDYRGDEEGISYKMTGVVIEDKEFKIFNSLPVEVREPKEHTTAESSEVGLADKKDVIRMLSKIDVKDFRDRASWMGVIASIYHGLGRAGEDLARDWSKTDIGEYDEKSFNNIWKQCVRGQFGESYTMASLKYHAGEVMVEDTFEPVEGAEEEDQPVIDPMAFLLGMGLTTVDYDGIDNQKYLIDGLIGRGMLGMITGDSGSYKSWWLMSRTKEILENHDEMRCHFIDNDAGAVYSKQRVLYMHSLFGAARFNYINQVKSDTEDMIKALNGLATLDELGNEMVVVDSLSAFVGGQVSDGTKKILVDFLRLLEVLRNKGATIIVVHHNKKGVNESTGKGEYAGSYTIKKAMDFIFSIQKGDDGKVSLDNTKSRGMFDEGSAFEVSDFEKLEYKELDYDTVAATNQMAEDEKAKIKKEDKTLAEHPTTVSAIKKAISTLVERYKKSHFSPNQSHVLKEVERLRKDNKLIQGTKAVITKLKIMTDRGIIIQDVEVRKNGGTELYYFNNEEERETVAEVVRKFKKKMEKRNKAKKV